MQTVKNSKISSIHPKSKSKINKRSSGMARHILPQANKEHSEDLAL
jgi:hypothetical protein